MAPRKGANDWMNETSAAGTVDAMSLMALVASAEAASAAAGASLAAVLGMVAGHSNARAISLVRWGARALKETAFAALMTAIAQGSHSRRRSVRVEALSLRGWTKASNGSVLTVLDTMQHL
ncbi:CUE domain-containing protein, partial [Haematococcus lacustris]